MRDWSYRHLTGQGYTQLATGPCTLAAVIINTKGASSNLLTLYDYSGSGTCSTLAVIDTTGAAARLDFGISVTRGLLVLSQTGTGADVTVLFG